MFKAIQMSRPVPCVRASLLVLAWWAATSLSLSQVCPSNSCPSDSCAGGEETEVSLLQFGPRHCPLKSEVIRVTGGLIKGSCSATGTCSFLGIPYAAPPVGDLRWAPPQHPERWYGIQDATQFGAICPQEAYSALVDRPQSESCLFLNVWAPQHACPKASCAVMLFIHGGGYSEGSGQDYDGTAFVELARNVVVVTVNYRLGILGFAGSEALRSRDPSGSTGNYGLQDQRMAMEWVRQNIHRFGGDSKNVLIFGQSAGSTSVALHMVTKRSWHLYHKVIMESGALALWAARPMSQAEMHFADVASAANCSSGRDAVQCLAAIKASELVAIATKALVANGGKYGRYGETFGAPTVDGVELKQLPADSLQKGDFNKEAHALMGFNKDEGTEFPPLPIQEKGYNLTEADFRTQIASDYGPGHVQAYVDLYKVGAEPEYTNWYWSYTHTVGDNAHTCPSRRMARAIGEVRRVFVYFFAHTPRAKNPFPTIGLPGVESSAGAFHTSELEFVWQWSGNSTMWPNLIGEDEIMLAKTMSSYWVNFAVNSDPNVAAGTVRTDLKRQWPDYASQREVLYIDLPTLKTTSMPYEQQCDMIDSIGI